MDVTGLSEKEIKDKVYEFYELFKLIEKEYETVPMKDKEKYKSKDKKIKKDD